MKAYRNYTKAKGNDNIKNFKTRYLPYNSDHEVRGIPTTMVELIEFVDAKYETALNNNRPIVMQH